MSKDRGKITELAIGFQNFRRFKEFPMLEFGPITYMVGKNNAGKSTLVKAILLISDYMKNQLGNTFSFANEVLNDANIVTFGRAKCNLTEDPFILFNFKLNQHHCEIKISGDLHSTSGNLNTFILNDDMEKIQFSVNYDERSITLIKSSVQRPKVDFSEQIQAINKEIQLLHSQLNNGLDKRSKEGLVTVDRIQRLERSLEKYQPQTNINVPQEYDQYSLVYPLRDLDEIEVQTEKNALMEIVTDFIYQNNIEHRKMMDEDNLFVFDSKKEENEFNIRLEAIRTLEGEKNKVIQSVSRFIDQFAQTEYHYLGANPTKQSALFLLRDKGNALAQAIHEFYILKIQPGDEEHRFVIDWIKNFEIGEDFKIEFRAGEAYQFFLLNNGIPNHLSDKGMGTLQAMMLILKVAGLIRLSKNHKRIQIVLVEEPELNLHPAHQSLLSDFFHEVYTQYGVRFIVETHSEYLIRKSQVFVNREKYGKKDSLNPNPFKVFYFPPEGHSYEMRYREDGKFIDEFQPGFFDVNSELVFDIL